MVRVCGNREDAEDVLMEALFKAYRHLDQLRHAVAFRSWLAMIAKRICWQFKEREEMAPLLQLSSLEEEGKELESGEQPIDAKLAMAQMKELIRASVMSLPAQDRKVYELRDLHRLAGGEVARALNISVSAMKSRLQRARRLLREQIDARLAGNRIQEETWKSR